MRNLKKFLALVLAMMMVFSLMATVSATSFPDDGNISDDYRQAVEVMSAIKVFKGDDDGKLNPKDPIKRAEFATVLYRVATGDVDGKSALLNTMADYDQFSDVNANSYPWAAKYINFAAQAGWLKGDEGIGGTYRPEDNVTVYQVLVALLRVLELGDGITSDNWQFQTAMKAGNIGLHEGLEDGDMGGYATREMIAQLALNALTYVPGENGKAGQPVVKYALENVAQHFDSPTAAESYAQQNGYNKEEDEKPAIEVHTVYPDSLAFNNFDHLHKAEGGRDKFGRPTVSWNDEKEIPVAESVLEPDYSYNISGEPTLTGKVAKTLEKSLLKGGQTFTVYYNGNKVLSEDVPNWCADGATAIVKGEEKEDVVGLWLDDSTGIPGREVYIYGRDVIVREAYLAEVGEAAKTGADIAVDVYEVGYCIGNDEAPVTLTVTKDDDIYETVAAYQGKYVAAYVRPEFSDPDAWEGAVPPAITTDADVILEIAPLDKVENVTITERDIGPFKGRCNTRIEASGKWYDLSNEMMMLAGTEENPALVATGAQNSIQLGSATLYLINGVVLVVEQKGVQVAGDTGYAYVYDIKQVRSTDEGYNWWTEGGTVEKDESIYLVKLLLADGTTLDAGVRAYAVALDAEGVADDEEGAAPGTETWYGVSAKAAVDGVSPELEAGITYTFLKNNVLGNLVWYGIDEDGYYWLYSYNDPVEAGGENGSVEVTNKKSEGKMPATDGAKDVAFDGETVFFVVTTSSKSMMVTKAVYDIYNVPDMNYDRGDVTAVSHVDVEGTLMPGDIIDADVDNGDPITRAVLIKDPAGKEVSDHVYFIVADPDATEVWMYKDKTLTGTALEAETNKIHYYVYSAVVDGKLQEVMVLKSIADDAFEQNEDGNNVGTVLLSSVKTTTYNGKTVITALGDEIDEDLLVNVETISPVVRDHISITGTVGEEETEETGDYLVSVVGGYAFTYDTETGTITAIKMTNLTMKNFVKYGWAENEEAGVATVEGYAVRDTKHTQLYALFLDVTTED